MGTSAPIRRSVDIPIVEPYKPTPALPAPDPSRIVTPFIPITQPAKQPERRN